MLKRGIQKWDLVLLIINSIIGAGIFGLPSKIFALSGAYSLLAFFACAIVVLVFIVCFAEVSSRFDSTGGPYVYTLEAFGQFPAFITGWLLLLSRMFNYATLINLLVIYLSFFSASLNDPLVRIGCILFITGLLTWINHIGVKNATRMNNILTVAKLAPLAVFIIVGLFSIKPGLFNFAQLPAVNSFSASIFLLVFAFGGFESVLINSGEIVNPKKNLPFGLLIASLTVVLFYCLIQVVCIGTLPSLAHSDKPLAEAAGIFMGASGGYLIATAALVSIFGTLNALMLSGSRLPYAFSNEDHFPKRFSYVHPKYATPTWSLLLFAVVTALVSIAWSFMGALTISVIIRVLVYGSVCVSLIQLRRKQPKAGQFKAPLGYLFPLTGIAFCILLLTRSKLSEIGQLTVCTLIGIIIYAFQKFTKKNKL